MRVGVSDRSGNDADANANADADGADVWAAMAGVEAGARRGDTGLR